MYPPLPDHVRNEQFCTADTAVRKVFSHPPTLTLLYILVWRAAHGFPIYNVLRKPWRRRRPSPLRVSILIEIDKKH